MNVGVSMDPLALIGAGINAVSSSRQQKRAIKAAKEDREWKYNKAIEFRDNERAYNDPAARRDRAVKAGFSPWQLNPDSADASASGLAAAGAQSDVAGAVESTAAPLSSIGSDVTRGVAELSAAAKNEADANLGKIDAETRGQSNEEEINKKKSESDKNKAQAKQAESEANKNIVLTPVQKASIESATNLNITNTALAAKELEGFDEKRRTEIAEKMGNIAYMDAQTRRTLALFPRELEKYVAETVLGYSSANLNNAQAQQVRTLTPFIRNQIWQDTTYKNALTGNIKKSTGWMDNLNQSKLDNDKNWRITNYWNAANGTVSSFGNALKGFGSLIP